MTAFRRRMYRDPSHSRSVKPVNDPGPGVENARARNTSSDSSWSLSRHDRLSCSFVADERARTSRERTALFRPGPPPSRLSFHTPSVTSSLPAGASSHPPVSHPSERARCSSAHGGNNATSEYVTRQRIWLL